MNVPVRRSNPIPIPRPAPLKRSPTIYDLKAERDKYPVGSIPLPPSPIVQSLGGSSLFFTPEWLKEKG